MKRLANTLGLLLLAGWACAQNPVTFQIHMDIQQELGNFNPDTDQVVVRGTFNGWGGANPTLVNAGDMLYTGTYDMPDELLGTLVEFKYVTLPAGGADNWESVDNRSFTLVAGATTLEPVYFNNQDSAGELTNVEVLFQVNMQVMTANGTFDPLTDWIVLRGGHANLGNWGGAVVMSEEGGNPGHYYLNIQFDNVEVDSNLEFKYVILEDQNEASARWESVANRLIPITTGLPDNDSDGYGEIVLGEAWFDDVTWNDIIAQDVTVHFGVDLWPVQAWFVEHPGETNQGLSSYGEITYTSICGPWNNWPWDLVPPAYQLVNTTGTLFEGDVLFTQFSSRRITYKYGANGHDNEAGFQADHVVVIDDTNPTYDVLNTFGELGDWWTLTDVDPALSRPAALELREAYPNPFNPVTTLRFVNREAADLRLSVINLAGQEVAVLSQGLHAAGEHQVSFDASALASGLYLARLEGQGVSATQKLLLVK
ncbi:MAG: carbohydrate-binding module family 20 domain-containing protein [Candidatus Delongbacteria bacterium]